MMFIVFSLVCHLPMETLFPRRSKTGKEPWKQSQTEHSWKEPETPQKRQPKRSSMAGDNWRQLETTGNIAKEATQAIQHGRRPPEETPRDIANPTSRGAIEAHPKTAGKRCTRRHTAQRRPNAQRTDTTRSAPSPKAADCARLEGNQECQWSVPVRPKRDILHMGISKDRKTC